MDYESQKTGALALVAIAIALFGGFWLLLTAPGATGSEDGLVALTGSLWAAWFVALLPLGFASVMFVWAVVRSNNQKPHP